MDQTGEVTKIDLDRLERLVLVTLEYCNLIQVFLDLPCVLGEPIHQHEGLERIQLGTSNELVAEIVFDVKHANVSIVMSHPEVPGIVLCVRYDGDAWVLVIPEVSDEQSKCISSTLFDLIVSLKVFADKQQVLRSHAFAAVRLLSEYFTTQT